MAPLQSGAQGLNTGSLCPLPAHQRPQGGNGESQPKTLRPHPTRADVLIEQQAGETPLLIKVCVPHQWASHGSDRYQDISACPACIADVDRLPGMRRYAALGLSFVSTVGEA